MLITLCLILQLEQMDLEVREMKQNDQPRLKTRIESYRVELGRLGQEFKRAKSTNPTQDGNINFYFYVSLQSLIQYLNLDDNIKTRLFVARLTVMFFITNLIICGGGGVLFILLFQFY